MNIIWKKPTGELAISELLGTDNSSNQAILMLSRGDAPSDWIAVGTDYYNFPSSPSESWRWVSGGIVDNGDRTIIIPTLTMRQARLALLNLGLLDEVEAAITSTENRIWWDYSTTVERNNPLVISVLAALGKSSAEIDALFIAASVL
jgi:hypothetical protein